MNKYTFETDKNFNTDFKKFHDRYVCPCCNYPTLHGRIGYEICGLCDWEDDGQDDHNADEVLGGPNQDYSLREAQENFKAHFTMYRPSDQAQFNRFAKEKLIEIKELYDLALSTDDKIEIDNLFRRARRQEDSLRK
jgi:hypothetical protein